MDMFLTRLLDEPLAQVIPHKEGDETQVKSSRWLQGLLAHEVMRAEGLLWAAVTGTEATTMASCHLCTCASDLPPHLSTY